MIIDKMKENQIDEVVEMLDAAKIFLHQQNINQWQNGYPNEETILEDIQNGNGYVFRKDDKIVGYAAIIFGIDPTYVKIYEGSWRCDKPYATIHRFMLHKSIRGTDTSFEIMEKAKEFCKESGYTTIRVDTHEDNKRMQKYVTKHGFVYCGMIYLLNNDQRLAYEYCEEMEE